MRQIEPYRLEGMEIHSTVLWHLQMEVQLSALAQDLVEFDKLSPEVRRFFSDNSQFFYLYVIELQTSCSCIFSGLQ